VSDEPQQPMSKPGQIPHRVGRSEGVTAASGVRWWAVLLGLVLIPPNALWLHSMELVWGSGTPTRLALFFNVVFILVVLVLPNLVLSKYWPRRALRPAELITIYAMLCLATAIGGQDFLETLVAMVATPAYFATAENQWQELFLHKIPASLILNDPVAAESFWEGGGHLYSWGSLRPWLVSALVWMGFAAVLLAVMIGICIVVRRRWNEQERLGYPLVELPYQLTSPRLHLLGRELLGNRLLWLGFGIAAGIDLLNGLAYLYPSIPALHVNFVSLQPIVKTLPRPWSAMYSGELGLAAHPFAIGIGYLMPLDFLFSFVFFFWLSKMQLVAMDIVGTLSTGGFPYVTQQSQGAYIAIGLFVLWSGRRYYGRLIRQSVLRRQGPESDREMSYAPVFVIIAVGFVILVVFCTNLLGATLPATVLFLGGYWLMALSITRMRAEFGIPTHELVIRPLHYCMILIGGGRAVGQRNMVSLSLLWWIVRHQTGNPMPHVLEGLTLGQRRGTPLRTMVVALSAAAVVALASSYWSMLHHGYSYGFIGRPTVAYFLGQPPFLNPAAWLTSTPPPHWERMVGLLIGTGFTLALFVLRRRYLSWPLHPAGFVIGPGWEGGVLWLPMTIAWTVKFLVVRYGGHKLYKTLMPFFLGLVLGEFVVGPIWGIIGTLGGFRVYRFWP